MFYNSHTVSHPAPGLILPYEDEICTFIIMFRIVISTLPSVSEGQLVHCTWIDRGALANYLWEIFFLKINHR